jgi:protein-S-isoprenylcysteine O-methyltransferase Ste14
MAERLSRFGVGPKIVAAVFVCAIAAWFVSNEFPRLCLIPALRSPVVRAFAWLLVGFGLVLWLAGAVTVMRAYDRDELVTSGPYAIVRHPMYSAWIVLIMPGLTLLTTSWPLLAAPLAAYAVFKRLIHREDEYLAKRYGRRYLDYRLRVHEIIPVPQFRRT